MKSTGIFFAGMLLMLSACEQSSSNQSSASAADSSNDSLFMVTEGPFAFSILLPKDLMISDSTLLRFMPSTGEMVIQIGEGFRLLVREESSSLQQLLEESASSGVFTNQPVEQDDQVVIYQQFLPTGEAWYYQVAGVVRHESKAYSVRSDPMGEFTLFEARQMAEAIRGISAPDA